MQQKLTSMRMYPHLQLLSGSRLLVTYIGVMLKEELTLLHRCPSSSGPTGASGEVIQVPSTKY